MKYAFACRCVALLGVTGLALTTSAWADTKVWNGGSAVDSKWDTGANWIGGSAPAATDDATFVDPATPATRLTVDLNGNRTVNSLAISTNNLLNLGNVGTANTLTLTSGGLTNGMPVPPDNTYYTAYINAPILLGSDGLWVMGNGTSQGKYAALEIKGAIGSTDSGDPNGSNRTIHVKGSYSLQLGKANNSYRGKWFFQALPGSANAGRNYVSLAGALGPGDITLAGLSGGGSPSREQLNFTYNGPTTIPNNFYFSGTNAVASGSTCVEITTRYSGTADFTFTGYWAQTNMPANAILYLYLTAAVNSAPGTKIILSGARPNYLPSPTFSTGGYSARERQ